MGSGISSGGSWESATNGGGESAGTQREPSQNCLVRGSQVMLVREPSATTRTVRPSGPAISVCASPPAGWRMKSPARIVYVRTSLAPDVW
jgi:hypothetical protein